MKNQYQNMAQTAPVPIQNIINTNNTNNNDFEAQYLKENETPDIIIVQKKTLLIDEKNAKITIKETNGDVTKVYDIIVPKSKEKLKN